MHRKRWLTAVIGLPLLILTIVAAPRWLFCALLCAAAVTGIREFHAITSPRPVPGPLRGFVYAATVAVFGVVYGKGFGPLPALVSLWAMGAAALCAFTRQEYTPELTRRAASAVLGFVSIAVPLLLLFGVSLWDRGSLWVFFVLTVTFAGDTGAFYVGRAWGKHKLVPRLSPGKTWEGAAGGLICSVTAGVAFLLCFQLHPMNGWIILVLIALSGAGQAGDLVESMLKRNHTVKDSGRILPGHGGILDRIDGLLFSIPILYGYLSRLNP